MVKRRGRGEGTVEQRGPGTWRLRAWDPATGRQVSKTVRAADKRGALKELRAFIAEVSEGNQPKTGPLITMGVLFDAWLPHLERRGRAKTTLLSYEVIIGKHLRPALGDTPLAKLTSHDIDSYYLAAQGRGLAARTIRLHAAILSGALEQAVDWGWRTDNPASRAHAPEKPKDNPKAPTPEQVRQLVAACEADIVFGTGLMLGALTGARRGELVGLRWSDVDWAAGTLTIERQRLPLKGGDETIPHTKTKVPRTVALGPAGMALLGSYSEALGFRVPDRPDGWLISYDGGHTPVLSKRFGALVTALGKQLGMPITTHSLRKFAATQLIGFTDVRTAAGRLGHDPGVMLRTYAGWVPERDQEAALQLGRVLGLPDTKESFRA